MSDTTVLKHKIDPDQPDAHRFEDQEEIFFQDEFEEALISICEHIDRLDNVTKSDLENSNGSLPDEEENLLHRHSTIGIFGQRGVGKTSFLLTIKDAFDDNGNSGNGLLSSFELDLNVDDEPEDLKDKVLTLDSIDPSRIENEDKLLVTITSKILDHVRENNDGDLSKNRAVQDALEDLSRRFRVLFSDATDEILKEAASDPLRFAGEVLFDADSGPKLAKAFHRFLALAAEDLGVRCFLLPIDDIDTSFDKGWPLLETLRKYLATDRLITVVSGDLEFFDLIVQQKAHERTEKFRKAESAYREKGIASDQSLQRKFESIRRFPGQYLQKIFPVNDRLRIPDIHSVVLDPDTDLRIDRSAGKNVPLGPALLVISRLLFGTAYIPEHENSRATKLTVLSDKLENEIDENRASRLSSLVGPNAIDALIPTNTRNFISFIEDIPESLEDLVEGRAPSAVSSDFRGRIAEGHSSLLRNSGLDVKDVSQLANGRGYHDLSRALLNARISSLDFARLRADLFRDRPSYDRWSALIKIVASALYADWASTLTGPIRYVTKTRDAVSVAEEEKSGDEAGSEFDLDRLGTGLNEPSWKSRCRLVRTVFSAQWDNSGRVESLGSAIRVPSKKRNNYENAYKKISPDSSVSPDYLRWWREVELRNENKEKSNQIDDFFGAKNRALISNKSFYENAGENAKSVYGMFKILLRRRNNVYRYIDFRRGLAKIDDLLRESTNTNKRNKGDILNYNFLKNDIEEFKTDSNVNIGELQHESSELVLRIRSAEDHSSESEDEKEAEKSAGGGEGPTDSERLTKLREAVSSWCWLGSRLSEIREEDFRGDTNSGTLEFFDGANIVPPPWVVVSAHEFFQANSNELSELPWRQHTVGTMLERHTLAYWNALLQKEVKSRIDQGRVSSDLQSRIDFGPVSDYRNKIVKIESISSNNVKWSKPTLHGNTFTRNIISLIDYCDKKDEIKPTRVIPYTLFWICCPFLLSVISNEVHELCVHGSKHSKYSNRDGLLRLTSHSIGDINDYSYLNEAIFKIYIDDLLDYNHSGRPDWQLSNFTFDQEDSEDEFDIHDIFCGIARADSPQGSPTNQDKKYAKKFGL